MMILSANYHLRLQIEIHTWVLIHPVMNLIVLTPISDQIQILNLIHFQRNLPNRKGTGPIYLPGHIHKLLSQEAKDAL